MKILCVGDIVGKPGRSALLGLIDELKEKHGLDFIVVNGENAAGGAGITGRIANGFLHEGVNVVTLGDHTWDQKDIGEYLNKTDRVIRPANFPENADTPGKGVTVQVAGNGVRVAVINMLGRTFMRFQVECPFKKARQIVEALKADGIKVIIFDMHAETTSEKVAIGHYLDGEVSVIFGTHTHIQTADEQILPQGTAYITDLGMTGPYDSVIGQNKKAIIERFLTSLPRRFSVAEGDVRLCGVIVNIDETTGKAKSIKRIQQGFLYSADKTA